MSTPGVSLFQGTETIKINSDFERAEEEEEIEDQRRRNEEIGNLLQNAFDDLEDEDTTVDSTTNFHADMYDEREEARLYPHKDEQYQTNMKPINVETYESEIHQLKVLLESRTNELESIKHMVKEEFGKKDELQKRLLITEAELERALAAKTNTHELLVESKEKCSNLENTISKLRNEKKGLELENNTLCGKLETAQAMLSDVQRKYDMVERDLNRNNDRNGEVKRKQIEERHRAEMEVLQQQLEQMDEKLRKKSNELENMNTRYQALQNSHDMMLVDKGSRINELNNALCEAQKKCEELMQKEDYHQENMRLQKLVASLQDHICHMEKTIKSLNERIEQTTAEIDVMDTLLHQHNSEGTPSRLGLPHSKVIGSTPMNTVDRVTSLKEELYRALANVKAKREEVKALQQTIEEKNIEIRHLKNEENKALVEITTLKEIKNRLESRVRVLEEDLEQIGKEQIHNRKNQEKIESLNQELKKIMAEKESLHKEHAKSLKDLQQADHKVKQLDDQLKNVQVDLEELRQEYENMKCNYEQIIQENRNLKNKEEEERLRLDLEKHRFLLKDAQAECDRLKKLFVDISNTKEALTYELEKLRNADTLKELQEHRDRIASLQRAVQLAEMKCTELTKMLESEKLSHERELSGLKEKFEKEKANQLQKAKETPDNCSKCLDYMAEITKFEIQNLKISNVSSMREKEIDDLTQELNTAKALIEELTEKLRLSEQQEHLIKELKTKASQFEEYIKSHTPTSTSQTTPKTAKTSPTQSSCRDICTETSPELEKHFVKKIEGRLREEMAKIFATELKRFQVKAKELEEKNFCLQSEYQHVLSEMHRRQNEVEVLKEAILAEREQMEEILNEKNKKYTETLQMLQKELSKMKEESYIRGKQINELNNELEERQKQIEAERKSMKAVMSQWEKQRKNIDEIESEWEQKLQDLRKTHETAIALWNTKYNSAKHTARNYKRYAEDKEAHFMKEYERIKMAYQDSLTKLETRLNEELAKKDKEFRERLASIEKKRQKAEENKENEAQN